MYSVAVRRDFIAQHYLIGGDWGAENQLHSHHYLLELRLEGSELDEHGYLLDIVQIERCLDSLVAEYRDRTLNDSEDFRGLNPSIEHFSRILAVGLKKALLAEGGPAGLRMTVQLWEHERAWASYTLE